MNPPVSDTTKSTTASSGSAWTLIGGLAVFVAILITVYAYVFPRLSGEPISPTASLEVRIAYWDIQDDTVEMTLPDGDKRFVSKVALLTATDFRTFSTTTGKNGTPLLTLHLSASGRKQLKNLNETIELGIVIHRKLIACISRKDWSEDRVTVALTELSSSDANELFARLTE
jgi:hypothetical protein